MTKWKDELWHEEKKLNNEKNDDKWRDMSEVMILESKKHRKKIQKTSSWV